MRVWFKRHAFRKSLRTGSDANRSPLNIALFDVCSVVLSSISEQTVLAHSGAIKDSIAALLTDVDFDNSITYATNDKKRVRTRFEKMTAAVYELRRQNDPRTPNRAIQSVPDTPTLPLSPLTLFTGFNAAGKSTALQTLLLLAQTLRSQPGSAELRLKGPLANLGTPGDVINRACGGEPSCSWIKDRRGRSRYGDLMRPMILGER